jgi:hypothetical protein
MGLHAITVDDGITSRASRLVAGEGIPGRPEEDGVAGVCTPTVP